ncbi:MAG: acyl-CoA dehydrogenase family protein [Anaerolineales bacterium]|nr:acyl-CoA dehydrogenase family protein [Anaerolineales bacterium]
MISFQPTDEQQMMADTLRDFARSRLQPAAHSADEQRRLDADTLATADEFAVVAANIPEEYGGFGDGYSALTGVLIAEALAEGDLSATLHLLAPAGVAAALIAAGSEAQKIAWLSRFANEGYFASSALIEPQWNYDPLALQTVARREGDEYVISGTKSLVIMPQQDVEEHDLLLFAHDEAAGMTQAFIVDTAREGVTIGTRERGMGLRALDYRRITFNEVRLPIGAKLGEAAGCDVQRLLNHARVGAAAMATGVARASYEFAQSYAKEREAFGKPVAQFQSIAFMLAEMRIAVESMRLLTWEAAWQLDQGQEATQSAVIAKQYADEYALQVADRAVQVLGGHGYIRNYLVERGLRDARAFAVLQGIGAI